MIKKILLTALLTLFVLSASITAAFADDPFPLFPASISGTVLDENGEPVEDATVEGSVNNLASSTKVTDDSGCFEYLKVVGDYTSFNDPIDFKVSVDGIQRTIISQTPSEVPWINGAVSGERIDGYVGLYPTVQLVVDARDMVPPVYQSAAINGTNKVVTLTFSENLLANVPDLKSAVTFAANGTNFAPLGAGDSVAINENTLVVTFNTALTGSSNKIKVAANSLKDVSGNVLSAVTTTGAIETFDITAPAYQGAVIDSAKKVVTMTFSENLVANVTDLKSAVTFSSDLTNFTALGLDDAVAISGNTLVVTFNTALTGDNNKVKVAANSLKDAAGNVLGTETTTVALVGLDITAPAYQNAAIDSTNKIVTLTFSETLAANVTDLKGAVTFSSDGTNFAALGDGDNVAVSGNTLVVIFDAALTGSSNKISIAAGSLKDEAGNILNSIVTTADINAEGKPGDINKDGATDIQDVMIAVNIALGRYECTPEEYDVADAYKDGKVDIQDVMTIVNIALGRI